jgi:hypothetical protein
MTMSMTDIPVLHFTEVTVGDTGSPEKEPKGGTDARTRLGRLFLQFSPFGVLFSQIHTFQFYLKNGPSARRHHYWRRARTSRRQLNWRCVLLMWQADVAVGRRRGSWRRGLIYQIPLFSCPSTSFTRRCPIPPSARRAAARPSTSLPSAHRPTVPARRPAAGHPPPSDDASWRPPKQAAGRPPTTAARHPRSTHAAAARRRVPGRPRSPPSGNPLSMYLLICSYYW